jgi:hypothetical protein
MQDKCIEKIIMSIRNIFLKCIFVEIFVLRTICIEEFTMNEKIWSIDLQ